MAETQVEKPKRTRRSVPRLRSGCLTCKIRKVKCDETKPSCTRCTSTGRTCDGYADVQPRRRKCRTNSTALVVSTSKSPVTIINNRFDNLCITVDNRERFALYELTYIIDSYWIHTWFSHFWSSSVHNTLIHSPCVARAAIAMGAFQEVGRRPVYSEEPLTVYYEAVRAINAEIDDYKDSHDGNRLASVLAATILLVCLDVLRGEHVAAGMHLSGATQTFGLIENLHSSRGSTPVSMLDECPPDCESETTVSISSSEERTNRHLAFFRKVLQCMYEQACLYSSTLTPNLSHNLVIIRSYHQLHLPPPSLQPEPGVSTIQTSLTPLDDVLDMAESTLSIITSFMHNDILTTYKANDATYPICYSPPVYDLDASIVGYPTPPSDDIFGSFDLVHIKRQLQDWSASFTSPLQQLQHSDTADIYRIQQIWLNYHLAKISLCTRLCGCEMDYDSCMEDFAAIIKCGNSLSSHSTTDQAGNSRRQSCSAASASSPTSSSVSSATSRSPGPTGLATSPQPSTPAATTRQDGTKYVPIQPRPASTKSILPVQMTLPQDLLTTFIQALYITILKCRDYTVRHRALELLHQTTAAGISTPWNVHLLIAVGNKVLELEHGDTTKGWVRRDNRLVIREIIPREDGAQRESEEVGKREAAVWLVFVGERRLGKEVVLY